jgi:hypothetical protein
MPVAPGATMLILKYFLAVGTALTLGLLALNAHMVGSSPAAPGAVIRTATSATLPTAAPKPQPVEEAPVVEVTPLPALAKSATPARRSARSQHRPQ